MLNYYIFFNIVMSQCTQKNLFRENSIAGVCFGWDFIVPL